MTNQQKLPALHGIFPTPVYITKRDLDFSLNEKKDIEDVIKGGMHRGPSNSASNNTYIFNNKLKEIKQFCEQQIKIYVEKIINPEKELDFYITQSWLNITKPGEAHHSHYHANSIISGVFYVSTEEDDNIVFGDPNKRLKDMISFKLKEQNPFNSDSWGFPVNNNELILFPSWLEHAVEPNKTATMNRISISFNTYVRGTLGETHNLTELILK